MGLFGLFYATFIAGAGIKELVIDSVDRDEAFKKALNNGNDIFYDKKGHMYFIEKIKCKNGKYIYEPIRAIDSCKLMNNGLHKIVVTLKGNRLLKDYTNEHIRNFLDRRLEIINETNANNPNQKYYYIPIDYKVIRDIGDKNFNKHYRHLCGLFEKENNTVGKRYCLQQEGDFIRGVNYYKYYYKNGDDSEFTQYIIDKKTKIKITKDEYEEYGGFVCDEDFYDFGFGSVDN